METNRCAKVKKLVRKEGKWEIRTGLCGLRVRGEVKLLSLSLPHVSINRNLLTGQHSSLKLRVPD